MRLFGLIGFPLTHSFSPEYFRKKFQKENIQNCDYQLFPIESIKQISEVVKIKNLCGLNVTIPFKESVLPYLTEVDDIAKEIGAVNTIVIRKNDQGDTYLKGYNTDVYGFEVTLNAILQGRRCEALVLGTGGAAKAVQFALRKQNIPYLSVSRTDLKVPNQINYKDLNESVLLTHHLIINTTPVGMHPSVNECPNIPYQCLGASHLLIDLIYNPAETLFLRKGRASGAETSNGLMMLEMQAEKAWEIWNQA